MESLLRYLEDSRPGDIDALAAGLTAFVHVLERCYPYGVPAVEAGRAVEVGRAVLRYVYGDALAETIVAGVAERLAH